MRFSQINSKWNHMFRYLNRYNLEGMYSLPLRPAYPAQISISFPQTITDDFSFEHWFRLNSGIGNYFYERSGIVSLAIISGLLNLMYSGNFAVKPVAIAGGDWHHVCLKVAKASTTYTVYFDGGAPIDVSGGAYQLIDYIVLGSTEGGLSKINGQLREMRLWNKALTLTNIQENMYT